MNPEHLLRQPHIKAKIMGTTLILISIIFLLNPQDLSIKIGFTTLLIGIFTLFLITEKTISQNISDAQINGNLNALRQITKDLNLQGNAIFIPQSHLLTQERIFIPLTTKNITLPEIDDTTVFYTGTSGKSLGIALPPSGIQLLQELEKQNNHTTTTLENVEEQLQTFVGMNLTKTITLKKNKTNWQLELQKPQICTTTKTTCTQYPCPICSAALTAITRAANKKIWITDTTHNKNKTIFTLKIEE